MHDGSPSSPFLPPILALSGVPGPQVDGFSFGYDAAEFSLIGGLFFSVTRDSFGAIGSGVLSEATPAPPAVPTGVDAGQSSDVFLSPLGSGSNALYQDDDGFLNGTVIPHPPLPGVLSLGLLNNGDRVLGMGAESHDVDGIDMRAPPGGSGSIFFTVDAASVGPFPGTSDAVPFYSDPTAPPGVCATAATLGLAVGDEINAMVVFDNGDLSYSAGDTVLFSLARTSPFLTATTNTPDDVFSVTFGAAPVLYADGTTIGLTPFSFGGDDLNALDVQFVIPEPTSVALILFGLSIVGRVYLRRKRA